MKIGEKKSTPIRKVKELPKQAVEGEIIQNLSDGWFYIGIQTQEDKDGGNVEKVSIRR